MQSAPRHLPRWPRGGALASLALAALLLAAASCDRARSDVETPAASAPLHPVQSKAAPLGLPAPAGDEAEVAAASGFLAPPVRLEWCGPYRLKSDLAGERLAELVLLCRNLSARFDGEYAQRVGVPPSTPAAGTLVLFQSRSRFRAYVAADAALPRGYAGFSLPWAGLVVLPVGDIADAEVARTLTHELAHLAHRRAFGRELPPWLAEGLADAIGDSATPQGYLPLGDLSVVGGIRKRLRGGSATGRVASLERLVALDRQGFDRDQPSYDYEQAALFTRFLLLHRELAPRFRRWLGDWAAYGAGATPSLDAGLGRSWADLESSFSAWLETS